MLEFKFFLVIFPIQRWKGYVFVWILVTEKDNRINLCSQTYNREKKAWILKGIDSTSSASMVPWNKDVSTIST